MFEKPWSTPKPACSPKGFFHVVGNSGFFRWWPKAFFQWSQQWLNIILPTRNYSKIKKLFKFQIYGSKVPSTPLQTPMQTKIIMFTCCKLRSSGNKLTRSFHKLKLCNRSPEFRLNHLTVFGLGSSWNHPKLLGFGFQLPNPSASICFIRLCQYCAAI